MLEIRKARFTFRAAIVHTVALVAAAVVVVLPRTAVASSIVSTTYGYTGATQTFTVPAGVNSLTVTLRGAEGGLGGRDSQGDPTPGGYQGVVTGVIAVTPGQQLTIAVGSGGGEGASSLGNAPGGAGGSNPLPGYDGAVGGKAGPEGSSGGGGGSGAATVLIVGGTTLVAGGAGGNGGNGQFFPIVGRRAENTHTPRADDSSSTTGRPGLATELVCSVGFRCDGGASGAGGGGAVGGERGAVQYGGDFATEYFGFGGFPGANDTGGLPGLTASYDFYPTNGHDGSITISYDDGAPSAPLNVVATPANHSVGLTWSAPANPGATPIIDYVIAYGTDPHGPFTTFADGVSTTTQATVTGLVNGTDYFFTVAAINSRGTGAAAGTAVAAKPSDVPAHPTVTALIPIPAGFYVDFTPGASDAPITGYEYRVGGGPWTAGSVTGNRMTISGLLNGQSYSVEIRELNAIGPSTASTPPQSGVPYAAPLAPTNVLLTPRDGAIDATWTAPTVTNGSPITDYVIYTTTSQNGPFIKFDDGVSTATAATITGLTNGVTYIVRVAAANAASEGPWSVTALATPFTTPDAPSIALTPQDGALSVQITPGFDGGSAVTGYEYRIGAGGTWTPTGSAATTFTIHGLANAVPSDVYVRAVNAGGPGAASAPATGTPMTVPSAPAISTVALDTGAVSVSFITGSDGGSALTNVEYSIDGGGTWHPRVPSSTVSPLAISGLVGGQTYPVALRLVNAAGASLPSNVSSVTAKGTPAAPVISVAPADSSAVVTFSAPANGGSPLTNYEYSTNGGTTWTTRSPASTASPLVIGGLTNGTPYSVRVRAVNAAGSGVASNSASVTPRTTPGAPSLESDTIAGNDGIIAVDYTAPVSDGGSAITMYQYSTDGGATWRDRAAGTVMSPLQISALSTDGTTPLTGGQVYPVEIRAVNAAGAGLASAVASGITTTVPSAPVIDSVDVSDSSATVHFTPGANGGSAIVGFEYRVDLGTWTSTGSLTNSFVIPNLVNTSTYSVQVRAINGVGNSDPSGAALVHVVTTPDAPTVDAITPGDQSLGVSFSAGDDGGSAITGYEYSTDGGVTWRVRSTGTTASPLSITTESTLAAHALVNGTVYAVQLRAVNAAGAGAASATILAAPQGAPSAPTGLAVTGGDGSLILNFAAGADGGSSITAYEYQVDGGLWHDAGSLASPITITGLQNGTQYLVALRARNAVGPGVPTVPQPGTPRTVPSAPTSVSAQRGSHQVVLSWAAPSWNGGAAVTGYVAKVYDQPTGGTVLGTCTTAGTSCTVAGLINGVTVYASAAATNAAGTGTPNSPRVGVTPLAAPQVDIAAIAPSATALSVAVAVIDWGGSPTTAYEYQLDGGLWHDAGTATGPITITGLTTGVSYAVRIRATNEAGTGAASAPMTGIPHTVPGAPTGLVAVSGGSSAALSWAAPANNGGQPIMDYVVQYATDPLGPFSTFADGATANAAATVTGLVNATAYYFRVAAVNTAGAGVWSLLASATPLDTPSAPSINSIQSGSGYLLVSFTAPVSNGGASVTGYDYRLDGGSWHSTNTTTSPMLINALTNGQTYGVEIRAVNAVGGGATSGVTSAKPYGLPSGVIGFRATPGPDSVTLEWDPVNDNGSAVTAYDIMLWSAPSEGSIFGTFHTTDTTYTIFLPDGTWYFTIEATNAAGTGPRSAPRTSAIIGVGNTVPTAPTGISAVVTNGVASLIWTAGDPGSSPITSSIVQYSVDGTTWKTVFLGSATGSASFTLPSTSVPYLLRVADISTVGLGAFATPIAPPLAATSPASDVTGTSATLTGTVNGNGGTASVAFEYATSAALLGKPGATLVEATPTSVAGSNDDAVSAALTGLSRGTHYVARTVATTADATAYGATISFATAASIVSSNLTRTYTGSPISVSTVTSPADLQVSQTYLGINGTTYPSSSTPPTAAGSYRVTTTSLDNTMPAEEIVTLTISPKPITATVTATNRLYDGTTHATLTVGLAGVVNGDQVGVNNAAISGAFADAVVGNAKAVTISVTGNPLTGPSAANYTVTVPASVTATIWAVPSFALSIDRAAGQPAKGASVHVVAHGLLGGSTVRVELHSAPVVLGTGTASGAGDVEMTATLPDALAPGTHHVVAIGTASDGTPFTQSTEVFVDWSGALVEPGNAGGGYRTNGATRILDTRDANVPLAMGVERQLALPAGLVPADVTAVVLNLTVTEASRSGYVTVYPCGGTRPLAAAINFIAGETKANLVDTPLASGQALCLWSNVDTHAVVDFQGYYAQSETSRLVPRTALRLIDTRPDHPVQTAGTLAVTVIGADKAPAGTTTVALNVAVDAPTHAGFLTVYPCGTSRPWASNLNFVAGQTVSNEVLVAPGSDGQVCVYSTAPTHVIVDLDGTYQPNATGAFTAVVPGRLGDTRLETKLIGGQTAEWAVDSNVLAVSLNVAATEPEGPGFLTVYPCGTDRPWASNLNFAAGQTISNHVTASVAGSGKLCVFSNVTTHVVIDVEGVYRTLT